MPLGSYLKKFHVTLLFVILEIASYVAFQGSPKENREFKWQWRNWAKKNKENERQIKWRGESYTETQIYEIALKTLIKDLVGVNRLSCKLWLF